MAKKIIKKPDVAEAQKPAQSITIETSVDTPIYYVNHIEVSHTTQHDFALTASQVPARPTPQLIATLKETGKLPVTATLVLTIPPTIVESLIKALETQKGKYEKSFGPIAEIKVQK